jgi:hypothetical protein
VNSHPKSFSQKDLSKIVLGFTYLRFLSILPELRNVDILSESLFPKFLSFFRGSIYLEELLLSLAFLPMNDSSVKTRAEIFFYTQTRLSVCCNMIGILD